MVENHQLVFRVGVIIGKAYDSLYHIVWNFRMANKSVNLNALWWIEHLYPKRHDGYVVKSLMDYPCNDGRRDSIRFWIRMYKQSLIKTEL